MQREESGMKSFEMRLKFCDHHEDTLDSVEVEPPVSS